MRSQKSQRYIHGSKPKEQRRLSGLNELLNQACLRELALTEGEAVLDVGSGLGQFTRDMARAVAPDGRAIGVEQDEQQLAEARRQAQVVGEVDLVEWRHGDALELPLEKSEWGRFDVAHARFVLEHVREPEQVVRQMVRASALTNIWGVIRLSAGVWLRCCATPVRNHGATIGFSSVHARVLPSFRPSFEMRSASSRRRAKSSPGRWVSARSSLIERYAPCGNGVAAPTPPFGTVSVGPKECGVEAEGQSMNDLKFALHQLLKNPGSWESDD